jgi:hypothetical protein
MFTFANLSAFVMVHLVCHLKRCLYGLKLSPREFNILLRDWLVENGWQ